MNPNLKHVPNIDGRQHPEVLLVEITAANFAANNAVITFEAQPGSILTSGTLRVTEAFDGTADTLDLGTPDDTDRYAADANLKTVANTTIAPDFAILGGGSISNKLVLTRTSTGTPTDVGKLVLLLQFVKFGKSYHTQG